MEIEVEVRVRLGEELFEVRTVQVDPDDLSDQRVAADVIREMVRAQAVAVANMICPEPVRRMPPGAGGGGVVTTTNPAGESGWAGGRCGLSHPHTATKGCGGETANSLGKGRS